MKSPIFSQLFADHIPEMIPPSDFPTVGVEYPLYRDVDAYRSSFLSVEGEEIKRLAEFHRAFTEYLNDRWNPDCSARVMKAYNAVSVYYDSSANGKKPTGVKNSPRGR